MDEPGYGWTSLDTGTGKGAWIRVRVREPGYGYGYGIPGPPWHYTTLGTPPPPHMLHGPTVAPAVVSEAAPVSELAGLQSLAATNLYLALTTWL